MVYRRTPPAELLEAMLAALGFHGGTTDTHWFHREELRTPPVELLAELESYYLPCKARRFFDGRPTDGSFFITVLRHLLDAHGYRLATTERGRQTLYQIQPARGTAHVPGPPPSFVLDFS